MSRLKYDYSTTRHIIEAFGGLKALETVTAQVEGLTLPSCPFCGGEAVVALGSTFAYPTASIECNHCHNGTLRMAAARDAITMEPQNIHDVLQEVARRWSRRREDIA